MANKPENKDKDHALKERYAKCVETFDVDVDVLSWPSDVHTLKPFLIIMPTQRVTYFSFNRPTRLNLCTVQMISQVRQEGNLGKRAVFVRLMFLAQFHKL